MSLEWHVMLATNDRRYRIVGLVEAVNYQGITITRLERDGQATAGSLVFIPWREVSYLMMCGPDRDDELFAAASESH